MFYGYIEIQSEILSRSSLFARFAKFVFVAPGQRVVTVTPVPFSYSPIPSEKCKTKAFEAQ